LQHPHDDDPSGDGHRYGYDPKQPRVPAGRRGGGQWTRGADGPQEQAVRLAFYDPTKPSRRVQSPPLAPTSPPPELPKRGLGGIALYLLGSLIRPLLPDGELDAEPVLVFRGRNYTRNPDGTWRDQGLIALSEAEIWEICGEKGLEELQKLIDDAASRVAGEKLAPGPAGTKAHQFAEEALKGKPDRIATEILIAWNEKSGKYEEVRNRKDNPKDSIRLDLRVVNGETIVCIGDYKFGERGLRTKRFKQILEKAAEIFRDATRILIFEGKPAKPLPKLK